MRARGINFGGAKRTTSDRPGAQPLVALERQPKIRIIGLTGSIGMGKSEAARMLKNLGVPVFEADRAVHRLLIPKWIEKAFPDCVRGGVVDRQLLGKKIFADVKAKERLESILHPLVRAEKYQFIKRARRERRKLVVLDIPLLFETGWEKECDAVMVVTAPQMIQRQRVLARAGMTEEKFAAILKHQMPDSEKRKRADALIHTGLGKRLALCEIAKLIYETNRT